MNETPQGLVMPKNPARALQELHRKQMEKPPGGTAETTAEITADDTAADTAVSTATYTANDTASRTDVLPPVSSAVQEERPPSVRDRIQSRLVREPTVRITIDVPETLHARLKEYCRNRRVESLRMLTLALYEELLSEEE